MRGNGHSRRAPQRVLRSGTFGSTVDEQSRSAWLSGAEWDDASVARDIFGLKVQIAREPGAGACTHATQKTRGACEVRQLYVWARRERAGPTSVGARAAVEVTSTGSSSSTVR